MIPLTVRPVTYSKQVVPAIIGDQLSYFSFIWAVTTLIHFVAFYQYWTNSFGHSPYLYLMAVAAIAVIMRPQSLAFFICMIVCSMAKTFSWLPMQANHILFEC